MTELALLDAECAAKGHPSDCEEPALGTVSQFQSESNNVTVTKGGQTKRLATRADANLDFPSHAHDYTEVEGCHDNASHKLLPPENRCSSSITIDGSPVFIVDAAVETDPKTNGDVDIVQNIFTTSIKEL